MLKFKGLVKLSIITSFFFTYMAQAKTLVILNKKSGAGKAVKIYREQVAPIFEEKFGKDEFDVHEVERGKEAYGLISKYSNASLLHGIISVGGDGTAGKIIQALIDRKCGTVPVGIIPAGSGNALAASIFHQSKREGDIYSPESMAQIIVSGRTQPLSLWQYKTNTGKTGHSFLGLSFGIISDIDIDSEPLRKILGKKRFGLMGFFKGLRHKSYPATLTYINEKNQRVQMDDRFRQIWALGISHGSEGIILGSDIRTGGEYLNLMTIRSRETSLCDIFKFLNKLKKDFINLDFVEVRKAKSLTLSLPNHNKIVVDGNLMKPQRKTSSITFTPVNFKANIFSR